jgi:GT2 family glycosyltransferase
VVPPDGVKTVDSAGWAGPPPEISVVVSTYRRPGFLPDLVHALEQQTLAPERFEVVAVDDGSDDGGATWTALSGLVAASAARMRAVPRPASGGPAVGRNEGVRHARGPVLAFTDDDCIPQPGWLAALLAAVDGGADLVQGCTVPVPDRTPEAGAWARTITITAATALFETCNIAYRRPWFERLGGFDEGDALTAPGAGRHFGEDAVLGGRLVAAGGRAAFSATAVVHHRWLPTSFAEHLRFHRRLAGFPGLATRSDVLAERLWHGVFLSPATATVDAAVVGVLAAAITRRPLPLALALPWLARRWPEAARRRYGRSAAVRLGQLAVTDLVGLGALLEGSARHRRLIL